MSSGITPTMRERMLSAPRAWPRAHLEREQCSFYIGDHHELACDTLRGLWYWTNDGQTFTGPYRGKKKAQKAWERQRS